MPCRFRTTAPMTLWPVQVARARYQSSPFGAEVDAARRIARGGSGFADRAARRRRRAADQARHQQLRFFLSGDQPTTQQLYELLFNHVTSVQVRLPQVAPAKGTRRCRSAILPGRVRRRRGDAALQPPLVSRLSVADRVFRLSAEVSVLRC